MIFGSLIKNSDKIPLPHKFIIYLVTMANQVPQLSFADIRSEIDKISSEFGLDAKQIHFAFERNEFSLKLELPQVSDALFVNILSIAKRHIENWRIHTFENGFMSIQALNENLFSSEGLLERIKIRLSALYGEKTLEISKKGNPTQAELSMIVAIVRLVYGGVTGNDPLLELTTNGCHVYLPDTSNIFTSGFQAIKERLNEVVIYPLKNPHIYDEIAQKTRMQFALNRPRAVLFTGPPGTGKTTMARYVASVAGFPVVHVPLETILSAYYGESTKRLALIFDLAASYEKGLIIFLDEIDALAPSRNEKLFEASRRLLSVLLRKIDGLETRSNLITIGATNRAGDLDHALLSRFDTIIDFALPDAHDIRDLLKFFAKHLSADDALSVSEKLLGFSIRAIKDICMQAERRKARQAIDARLSEAQLPEKTDYLKVIADYSVRKEHHISSAS